MNDLARSAHSVAPEIASLSDRLCEWRRYLHQYPETAFAETTTAAFVAEKLREFGLEIHTGLAQTGVVGVLTNGDSSRSIGLRAELDAIDVQERNDFDYCSKNPGKMHACGHDGHAAMLLGAAAHLARSRQFDGTIYFIFQPGEENECGGRVMVEEGLFEQFPADSVYGMHNWPGLEAGRFAITPGPVMAGDDKFEITIEGRGCHAAMPHLGIHPIPVAAQIADALQGTVGAEGDPDTAAVISVTQIHSGEAWNAIPRIATLGGTVRCFTPIVQEQVQRRIEAIAHAAAQKVGATAQVTYRRCYPPTINHEREAAVAADIARSIVGDDHVITTMPPSMGAEDFSIMLLKRPGCYVWIGAQAPGRTNILHNPGYDFNDDILPLGVAFWTRLAEHVLSM